MRPGRVVAAAAALLLLGFPATASADVIFDPADADELATVLEEAAEGQDVCYGWDVVVDDAVAGRDNSVGSNFGAGQSLDTAGDSCGTKVQFKAFITYTSESSESEDSATFDVVSTPRGPTTDDLNNLDLGLDGLTGDNVDAVVAKAVAALPLLAADAGVADPIEASPAPETEAADAQLTDSPGSDFWRRNSNFIYWGGGLLLAGIVFAVYVIRTARRSRYYAPVEEIPPYIPDTVPDDFLAPEPQPAPAPKPAAEPEPGAQPAPKSEAAAKPEAAPEPEPQSASRPEPAPEAEPQPEADAATTAPPPEAALEAEPQSASRTESAPKAAPQPSAEPEPQPQPASRPEAPEADAEPADAAPPPAPEAEPGPKRATESTSDKDKE